MKKNGRLQAKLALPAVAAAILVVVLCAPGCNVGPTETRDDSFDVGESARLSVNSQNGSITVNSGPQNGVRVQANLRGADKLQYNVIQDGNTITVDVKIEKRWWDFGNVGADITITTPVRTDFNLDTSNGSIELHGIEGVGSVNSSNGRLVLTNATGDFNGSTSNGNIEIGNLEGSAKLRTSNGHVDLLDVKGEFDVETSNGAISFSGEMINGGDNRMVSSNGKVELELRGTPGVSLDASTSNGDIISKLPILATLYREDHITGTIGEAVADLYIRTSNGDVTIS